MRIIFFIIIALILASTSNAKDVFICRDLGYIKVNNQIFIAESKPYQLEMNVKNNYIINYKKDKNLVMGNFCARSWDIIIDEGISFNDFFYNQMQVLRNGLTAEFLNELGIEAEELLNN